MQFDRYGAQVYAQQVCWLPLDRISPRPSVGLDMQDGMTLMELVDSIRCHGLIQPVTVQPATGGRFVIVSGNRRLMACRMAGLTHIDAVVLSGSAVDGDLRQAMDMLLSHSLHYLQEADAMQRLLGSGAMTREDIARMLGCTVSTVRERMRLAELDDEVRAALLEGNLPEKCARALLKLPDRRARLSIARQAVRQKLGVRDVELLVASAQTRLPVPPVPGGRTIALVRDHRLYLNAIRAIVAQMQEAGIDARAEERTLEGSVEMTLRLPTRRRRAGREGQAHPGL